MFYFFFINALEDNSLMSVGSSQIRQCFTTLNIKTSVNVMVHLCLIFTRLSLAAFGNPHLQTWNPVGLLTLSHSCCRRQ